MLSALVAAALHAPHAEGRVLCVEPGGQADIEVATGGSCASDETLGQDIPDSLWAVANFRSENSTHCDDCEDIPLLDHPNLIAVGSRAQAPVSIALVPAYGIAVMNERGGSRDTAPAATSNSLSHFGLVLRATVSLQR